MIAQKIFGPHLTHDLALQIVTVSLCSSCATICSLLFAYANRCLSTFRITPLVGCVTQRYRLSTIDTILPVTHSLGRQPPGTHKCFAIHSRSNLSRFYPTDQRSMRQTAVPAKKAASFRRHPLSFGTLHLKKTPTQNQQHFGAQGRGVDPTTEARHDSNPIPTSTSPQGPCFSRTQLSSKTGTTWHKLSARPQPQPKPCLSTKTVSRNDAP